MDVRFQLGELAFVWDAEKHAQNILKHGVAFEEAVTTWLDANALERFDATHSTFEERWIRIGLSRRGALVVTWSTVRMRRAKELIRIIGARRATKGEWRLYGEEES